MKIVIRELREGPNPLQFSISADRLNRIVKDMDELYAADADGDVDLEVQKYQELMHLRGSVRAKIHFECGRCLAVRHRDLEIPIHWTLMPKGQAAELNKEEIELTTDDLDTSFYEGDEIDLEELAREAILLEIDSNPRCAADEDCEVGEYVSEESTEAQPAEDPRWAPLKKMLVTKKDN